MINNILIGLLAISFCVLLYWLHLPNDREVPPDLSTGRIRYVDVSKRCNGAVWDMILECKSQDGDVWLEISRVNRVLNGAQCSFERYLEEKWIEYCRKHGKNKEYVKELNATSDELESSKKMVNDVMSLTSSDIQYLLENRK